MPNQYHIEARPQEKWPPEYIQGVEGIFQAVREFFRQAGLSQERIDAFWELNRFFRLIKAKVYEYCQTHSEEIMRH